jgi:hypothetical protein
MGCAYLIYRRRKAAGPGHHDPICYSFAETDGISRSDDTAWGDE